MTQILCHKFLHNINLLSLEISIYYTWCLCVVRFSYGEVDTQMWDLIRVTNFPGPALESRFLLHEDLIEASADQHLLLSVFYCMVLSGRGGLSDHLVRCGAEERCI